MSDPTDTPETLDSIEDVPAAADAAAREATEPEPVYMQRWIDCVECEVMVIVAAAEGSDGVPDESEWDHLPSCPVCGGSLGGHYNADAVSVVELEGRLRAEKSQTLTVFGMLLDHREGVGPRQHSEETLWDAVRQYLANNGVVRGADDTMAGTTSTTKD